MKTIASFTINHDVLTKGMYISRIDGDCVTYDIRMKLPNNPENDYLDINGMHTIEHLMATYLRNTQYSDSIIYVGPMGCRTGFYFIARDTVSTKTAIKLVYDSMKFISEFEGEIPGSKKKECGNYLAHNLDEAKKTALDMVDILENWTVEKTVYPQ
jgi:S-ribosylhomocysteine lyase